MDDFAADLSRALKYSRERLSVAAIHPELRFTRLGAVLREHAAEPSDVGELSYQAITGDHSQPLDLMPLHLLRDKMQEEPEHPLASKFNWATLPERVALDQTVGRLRQTGKVGGDVFGSITFGPDSDFHGANPRVDELKSAVMQSGLTPTRQELKDSAVRQYNQMTASRGSGVEPDDEESHTQLASDDRFFHPADTYR